MCDSGTAIAVPLEGFIGEIIHLGSRISRIFGTRGAAKNYNFALVPAEGRFSESVAHTIFEYVSQ